MSCIDDIVPVLDVLCPMHMLVSPTGHVLHAGPTLQKLRPDAPMAGQRLLELFELRRPRSVRSMDDLMASSRLKLHLRFRDGPATALKGVLMPLPEDPRGAAPAAVVNLSFGISILDAVRDYDLSAGDFAATDLTVEMLYLVEAKSAAMAASRKLNLQLQSAKVAAEEQAFTDTLTGLKNRRAMDHVLRRLIAGGRPFALMHVDLDFFKAVNDTMGHAAGDHVLAHVARIMIEQTRSGDTVARVGGDEFVILFDGLVDRKRLDAVAKRLIGEMERPIAIAGRVAQISASAGTVVSRDYDAPEAARMLADADLALYASKRCGRASHTFFADDLRDADAAAAGSATPTRH